MNSDSSANMVSRAESHETVRQVADLVALRLPHLRVDCVDSTHFRSAARNGDEASQPPGICTVLGSLQEPEVVSLQVELVRIPKSAPCLSAPYDLFSRMGALGVPLQMKSTPDGEHVSLWMELQVRSKPLGPSREVALLSQIDKMQHLAQLMGEETSAFSRQPDLTGIYAEFKDHVEPVYPLDEATALKCKVDRAWARKVLDYFAAGTCLALEAPSPAETDYALALLATVAPEFGQSVGQIVAPVIHRRELSALADKVPGTLAVHAGQVQLGVNSYERSAAVRDMLSRLKPVLFYGSHEELQVLFQGGQGDTHSPLKPIVVHAIRPSIDVLASHAVSRAARAFGGLPAAVEKEILAELLTSLKECPTDRQQEILPLLTNRAVQTWRAPAKGDRPTLPQFAGDVASLAETLGGLPVKPRTHRSAALQSRLTGLAEDDGFLDYLKEHILCQDTALDQFVTQLRAECLRLPHEPLRLCLQGTPGCGKSESVSRLAKRLEAPYVYIDAASMSDYHTAISQLLGSGRGIVHSEKRGRLEEAAKHHQGAVIEVADLDHAPVSVRATMADVFFQALQSGEMQSAMGNVFSCANIIFVFTMNLPNGADESVRKKVGFHNTLTRAEISQRVTQEIKEMLSGAFLSRVGEPVLFDPLDGPALAAIVERTVRASLAVAAERLHLTLGDITVDPHVPPAVVDMVRSNLTAFGARVLMEKTRSLVAAAAFSQKAELAGGSGGSIHVSIDPDGALHLLSEPSPAAQLSNLEEHE